jgi:hypothetical protein
MDHVEFKALKVFACYYINGDADALTREEMIDADDYVARLSKKFGRGHIDVTIEDGDTDFGRCAITGMEGDRAEFRFVIMEGK